MYNAKDITREILKMYLFIAAWPNTKQEKIARKKNAQKVKWQFKNRIKLDEKNPKTIAI